MIVAGGFHSIGGNSGNGWHAVTFAAGTTGVTSGKSRFLAALRMEGARG